MPDREMTLLEEDCAKKGLTVRLRNAEPYREFQNMEDNDRYYGMNEGYVRNHVMNHSNDHQQHPTHKVIILILLKQKTHKIYRERINLDLL